MNNYIKETKVNLFSGLFQTDISFNNGLNIIAGENGTGKTKLLCLLKDEGILNKKVNNSLLSREIKVLAISPKRNFLRISISDARREFTQQNKQFKSYIASYLNKTLHDDTFEPYSSFEKLFAIYFELKYKKGKNTGRTIMNKIVREFNQIIQRVFTNYKLSSEWDENNGNPEIKIIKNGTDLKLNNLSCGEREILSLIFNLYISRKDCDVILIDEPEIHLNWDLELRLFKFLKYFCKEYKKQIIVTTHSRIVFNNEFIDLTQFLIWRSGKIICKKDIDKETKNYLAGEFVSIIKQTKLTNKTFYVEDNFHKMVLDCLAQKNNNKISVVTCDNKSNVNSIYNTLKDDPEFSEAYFMVDSDNEGNSYLSDERYIFLDKYCLECYFLDPTVLKKIFNKKEDKIQHEILSIIKANKKNILKNYTYLEFLLDRLKYKDINSKLLSKFNCKHILNDLIKKFDSRMKMNNFIIKYLDNKTDKHKGAFKKLDDIINS